MNDQYDQYTQNTQGFDVGKFTRGLVKEILKGKPSIDDPAVTDGMTPGMATAQTFREIQESPFPEGNPRFR